MFLSIISGTNYVIELKPTDIDGHIFLVVLWTSLCAALITFITVSCSLAVNECDRSPVIVQKIILRDDIDSELMKELEKMFTKFKVMMIRFSACGMYKIDFSFLCGIIGGTLSYLIIVPQL
jgi:cytochrome bd-type quinol oxidase subunit 1